MKGYGSSSFGRSPRPGGGLRWARRILVAVIVLAVAAGLAQWFRPVPTSQVHRMMAARLTAAGTPVNPPWPATGEAALAVGGLGTLAVHGAQQPVAIASIAKVMTAYIVLTDHPLSLTGSGPSLQFTAADAAAYRADVAQQQSVVRVVAGERMTEAQALQALLIPSANNIAQVLGRWDAGSVSAFVAKMNATAARLGLRHTHYTDPSGFASSTVSTAADQVSLAQIAMRLPRFAAIVAEPQVTLPVAGTLYNYDYEVGHDGFVGIKTGSDAQAGGCWMFAAQRTIAGARRTVYGVVLGQHGKGGQLIQPALDAGRRLADAAPGLLRTETVLPAGTVVGYVDSPWQGRVALRTMGALSGLVAPGQQLQANLELTRPGRRALPSGARLGTLRLTGAYSGAPGWSTPVVLAGPLRAPGWKWRLTRMP